VQIEIATVTSFEALGTAWRELEATGAACSFFQSWTWIGCLAEERYPDPVLLRANSGGRLLGLALLNRRHGRLCLAESGEPALDAPFIEHNAPLLAADAGPEVEAALLRAAWRVPGVGQLVLGGVPPHLPGLAGGIAWRWQVRPVPLVALGPVRAAGGDYLAGLSANSRYQIRRSARRYAAFGALRLDRAGTLPEALEWLEALAALHGETWRARGRPGAFADGFAQRFHQALVARAQPRGELDLLRVTAGERVVGYLYNFRLRGRVYAYQSGLDHAGAGPHGKPGLTCHAMAVERAIAEGAESYDFLAGPDRYKRSLANAETALVWAELVPRWSARGVVARLRGQRDRSGDAMDGSW
jgi:CelD/BcsL family acetyltransferase involved in cellulose biosynthesis